MRKVYNTCEQRENEIWWQRKKIDIFYAAEDVNM